MDDENYLEKLFELYESNNEAGSYIIGLCDLVSRTIDEQLKDDVFDNSFDILTKNFIDFYNYIETKYKNPEFTDITERFGLYKQPYESIINKLNNLNFEDSQTTQEIIKTAGSIVDKFSTRIIKDQIMLENLYNHVLTSCIILYESIEK
ncbi:MAG: hypothetical protein ACQESF_04850 [Nanobdellota archaeon]